MTVAGSIIDALESEQRLLRAWGEVFAAAADDGLPGPDVQSCVKRPVVEAFSGSASPTLVRFNDVSGDWQRWSGRSTRSLAMSLIRCRISDMSWVGDAPPG